jgi:hypothetical protein
LATEFLLQQLQWLALGKFQVQLTGDWATQAFCRCIREIYSSSRCRALRSVVIDVAFTHLHRLATEGVFVKFLEEGGEFACDYLIKIHQRCFIPTI